MPSSGTWVATTIVGCVASLWLYKENRALRAELESKPAPVKTVEEAAPPSNEPVPEVRPAYRPLQLPSLPIGPSEQTRLDKRAQKQQELSAMFGRMDGETDEQYRGRVLPFVSAALAIPRKRIAEMRRLAEDKAQVTPDQHEQIDQSFQQVYTNVLAYANKAIADGSVSPYERNIASWLQFGGGLGSILEDADSQINHILSTDQIHAMYDTGFEWGEYLGLETPWEQLNPPPPKR